LTQGTYWNGTCPVLASSLHVRVRWWIGGRMRLLATGGICVGLTIAGCTGQGNDVAGPTEEPSPSEAPISAEDAALDAYDSMWEVVVEASHEGEPDPPELSTEERRGGKRRRAGRG